MKNLSQWLWTSKKQGYEDTHADVLFITFCLPQSQG